VEHLADESSALHEGERLAHDEGILQGHAPRDRADLTIQGEPRWPIEPVHLGNLRPQRIKFGQIILEIDLPAHHQQVA
jgi:hypothetical protein